MNAKFESWFSEKNAPCWNAALSGDAIAKGIVAVARDSYHTAIQSLEVTPELVGVGMRAEVGPWKLEDLVSDPNYLDLIVESILEQVLSALKEQAK
ncbi:hypothetical protein ACN9MB_13320 [Dyella kyungheensis]|uniref:hypothetical protein n=1 Tax=Dyella kyungheensis TaxID=1242174 RepID=UPI003CF23C5E